MNDNAVVYKRFKQAGRSLQLVELGFRFGRFTVALSKLLRNRRLLQTFHAIHLIQLTRIIRIR